MGIMRDREKKKNNTNGLRYFKTNNNNNKNKGEKKKISPAGYRHCVRTRDWHLLREQAEVPGTFRSSVWRSPDWAILTGELKWRGLIDYINGFHLFFSLLVPWTQSCTFCSCLLDMDLGFVDDCDPLLLTSPYFPSKVGGKPVHWSFCFCLWWFCHYVFPLPLPSLFSWTPCLQQAWLGWESLPDTTRLACPNCSKSMYFLLQVCWEGACMHICVHVLRMYSCMYLDEHSCKSREQVNPLHFLSGIYGRIMGARGSFPS